MVLLLCLLFFFFYKCGNLSFFKSFFERRRSGGGGSQSTPGSFNIKIYNHIFLAHLNNGSGFYILSYREVLFIFYF